MKLYLFGHGMMLFWYRRRTSESADGYRILIPQSPVMDGENQHEFLIGTKPGAADSPVCYPDEPQPTVFYELQFGAATSVKPRGPKDCSQNIGLYERYGLCKAEPNYGYEQPDGVAFAIDIPYPECDDQLRPVKFDGPAYLPGYTREDFQIYPKCIPRSNLFTYELECPDLPVVLQDKLDPSHRFILKDPRQTKDDVMLYLYSGPPHIDMSDDHVSVLNAMLRYGNHTRLDLQPNQVRTECLTLCETPIPGNFKKNDYRHLAEFNDQGDYCKSGSRGANPAECTQGGGC